MSTQRRYLAGLDPSSFSPEDLEKGPSTQGYNFIESLNTPWAALFRVKG